MVQIDTHIEGERVVAAFPIIGGHFDGYVEAHVVTTDGDIEQDPTHFTVRRVKRNGEVAWSSEPVASFPDAIRTARKNAGWG